MAAAKALVERLPSLLLLPATPWGAARAAALAVAVPAAAWVLLLLLRCLACALSPSHAVRLVVELWAVSKEGISSSSSSS